MKIKNLYVVDIVKPMEIMKSITCTIENATCSPDHICEKVEFPDNVFFRDLEDGKEYPQTDRLGVSRIEEEAIPLSDYYNFMGFKKKNNHANQEKVYDKVKKLKKQGIL